MTISINERYGVSLINGARTFRLLNPTCRSCGRRQVPDERYGTSLEGFCERCAVGICTLCDMPVACGAHTTHPAYPGYVHLSHLATCQGCHQSFLIHEMTLQFNGRYCRPCTARLTRCEIHGHVYTGDDCNICLEFPVQSHNYRPRTIPLKGNGPLFLGVELEIETSGEYYYDWRTEMGALGLHKVAYIKHDGSLSDGFELVTLPCSLDYHLKEFPWAQVCQRSSSYGYRADTTSTAGLHVHLSRNAYSLPVWQRVSYLVNNSRRLMEKIARRSESERYAAFKPKLKIGGAAHSETRYEAVNFTNNNTVEFRMFRSTLQPYRLYATLEFCVGVTRFCDTHTGRQLKNLRKAQGNLLDYLRGGDFAYLPAYLQEVGL